jgi:hypothetical protein
VVFLALCLAVLLHSVAVLGCGGEGGGGAGQVLTVEQALASEPGETIRVIGAIVATGSGPDREIVLASVLMESYPPQAGGAVLDVTGLDLGALVGLNSTEGRPDLAPVTWSDYWIVLEGVVSHGVLQVQETPAVVEATLEDLHLRFSPVSDPMTGGTTVWWVFDLGNNATQPLDLTFSSGQRAEVVLSRDGEEEYRWSHGKAFTEAIETARIAAGEVLPIVMNDTLEVSPGEYDLMATVTVTLGSEGMGQQLPALTMSVTVF